MATRAAVAGWGTWLAGRRAGGPAGGGGRWAPPVASTSRSCGPQAGQQTGWAWNRRLAGRRTPRAHAAHIAKPAMVVSGRSYGTSRTMVNRGPAVRAVDEQVAEPPVGRVGELPQAVRAGRGVRGDQRAAAARARVAGHRLAGDDGEPGAAVRRDGLRGHPLHLGQRRRVPGQRGQEVRPRPRAPRPPRTRHRRRCRPSQPGPAWWPGSRRTGGTRLPGPRPHPDDARTVLVTDPVCPVSRPAAAGKGRPTAARGQGTFRIMIVGLSGGDVP